MPNESLFGLPPELIQQQQQDIQQRQAMDFAQLDPYQRATFGAYSGGAQLADALGGMMGGGDPQMNIARMRQSILADLDPTDPASYQAAATKLLKAKDYQGAQQLVAQAQTIAQKASEVRYKDAETAAKLGEKLTPEQKNAAAMADATGATRGSPEWVKGYQEHLSTLTGLKDKGEIKEVGVAEGSKEAVYSFKKDGQVQQVVFRKGPDGKQTMVPYEGAVSRVTSETRIKMPDTVQENSFAKKIGEKNAERLDEAMTSARASALALRTLNGMEVKNNGSIYSGPQADLVKDTSNFLESVGLLSKEQTKKLTDSTTYDKFAKDLVMQDLGGKLGAQVSDADRKFVEARIPQLTTNPQARQELIDKLKELHGKKITYYRKMQAHAAKYKTLDDFDFPDADGITTPPTVAKADPLGLRK